jgi:hypothetical protein
LNTGLSSRDGVPCRGQSVDINRVTHSPNLSRDVDLYEKPV